VPDDSAPEAVPISARKLHVRVGLAFIQTLRPLLYALLASSAALTFLAADPGRLPSWLSSAAPALFGAFLLVFAVYRLKLMSARRYPALLGFFQIGLGALVFVLLLPGSRGSLESPPADDVAALLTSSDPRARAIAAEAAGGREGGQRYAAALVHLVGDREPRVRESARRALARLAGADVAAGKEDAAAESAWRDEARRRGWLQ
jgi:hypothetical protein